MTQLPSISPFIGIPTIPLTTLIILALAVFRITRLVVRDHFFDALRNKIWERFNPRKTMTGYLLTCEWCVSIWVSVPVVFFYAIYPSMTVVVCCIFALSAISSLISARLDD